MSSIRFDKDVVTAELLKISKDGVMPSKDEWEAHRKANRLVSYKSVYARWGPFERIADELGLIYETRSLWDREQVIAEGKRLSGEFHIVTTVKWTKNKKKGAPSVCKVLMMFGSWEGFAEACGKYPNQRYHKNKPLNIPQQSSIFMPKQRREPTFENPDFFAETHVPMAGVRA